MDLASVDFVFVFLEGGGETHCPFVREEDGGLSKAGEGNRENCKGHPPVSKQ